MGVSEVVRVSQRGYDATDCADYQLLFSSEWPTLKIAFSGKVTISNPTTNQIIFTHNLGFKPMYLIFIVDTDGTRLAGQESFGVDNNYLKFATDYSVSSFTAYYYIYYQDLDAAYTAPNILNIPQTADVINDYGIKISKPGHDTDDPDYRNYILNSDCKSLTLHKMGSATLTYDGTTYSYTISTGLTYVPMMFTYIYQSTPYPAYLQYTYSYNPFGNHSDTLVYYTAGSIKLSSTYALKIAYVLFKDPLDLG